MIKLKKVNRFNKKLKPVNFSNAKKGKNQLSKLNRRKTAIWLKKKKIKQAGLDLLKQDHKKREAINVAKKRIWPYKKTKKNIQYFKIVDGVYSSYWLGKLINMFILKGKKKVNIKNYLFNFF